MQSLEEAKKLPKKSRVPCQQPKLPHEVNTKASARPNHSLDIELLKEELNRKNYIDKFHHLLMCEEQEHHRILNEK